jgi:hypothetical protein
MGQLYLPPLEVWERTGSAESRFSMNWSGAALNFVRQSVLQK